LPLCHKDGMRLKQLDKSVESPAAHAELGTVLAAVLNGHVYIQGANGARDLVVRAAPSCSSECEGQTQLLV
jgi:hypothetical protein